MSGFLSDSDSESYSSGEEEEEEEQEEQELEQQQNESSPKQSTGRRVTFADETVHELRPQQQEREDQQQNQQDPTDSAQTTHSNEHATVVDSRGLGKTSFSESNQATHSVDEPESKKSRKTVQAGTHMGGKQAHHFEEAVSAQRSASTQASPTSINGATTASTRGNRQSEGFHAHSVNFAGLSRRLYHESGFFDESARHWTERLKDPLPVVVKASIKHPLSSASTSLSASTTSSSSAPTASSGGVPDDGTSASSSRGPSSEETYTRKYLIREAPWEPILVQRARDLPTFRTGPKAQEPLPPSKAARARALELQSLCNTKVRPGTWGRGRLLKMGQDAPVLWEGDFNDSPGKVHGFDCRGDQFTLGTDSPSQQQNGDLRAEPLDIFEWEGMIDFGYTPRVSASAQQAWPPVFDQEDCKKHDPADHQPLPKSSIVDSAAAASSSSEANAVLGLSSPGKGDWDPSRDTTTTGNVPLPRRQNKAHGGMALGQPVVDAGTTARCSGGGQGTFASDAKLSAGPTSWKPEFFWAFLDAVDAADGKSIGPGTKGGRRGGNANDGTSTSATNHSTTKAKKKRSEPVATTTEAALANGPMTEFSLWDAFHPVSGAPMSLSIVNRKVYLLRFSPPGSVDEIIQGVIGGSSSLSSASSTDGGGLDHDTSAGTSGYNLPDETLGTLVSTHIADLKAGSVGGNRRRSGGSNAGLSGDAALSLVFTPQYLHQCEEQLAAENSESLRGSVDAASTPRSKVVLQQAWDLFSHPQSGQVAWVPAGTGLSASVPKLWGWETARTTALDSIGACFNWGGASIWRSSHPLRETLLELAPRHQSLELPPNPVYYHVRAQILYRILFDRKLHLPHSNNSVVETRSKTTVRLLPVGRMLPLDSLRGGTALRLCLNKDFLSHEALSVGMSAHQRQQRAALLEDRAQKQAEAEAEAAANSAGQRQAPASNVASLDIPNVVVQEAQWWVANDMSSNRLQWTRQSNLGFGKNVVRPIFSGGLDGVPNRVLGAWEWLNATEFLRAALSAVSPEQEELASRVAIWENAKLHCDPSATADIAVSAFVAGRSTRLQGAGMFGPTGPTTAIVPYQHQKMQGFVDIGANSSLLLDNLIMDCTAPGRILQGQQLSLNLNDAAMLFRPMRRVRVDLLAAEAEAKQIWSRQQRNIQEQGGADRNITDTSTGAGGSKKREREEPETIVEAPGIDDGIDAIKTAITAPESTNLAKKLIGVPEWRDKRDWLLWHRPRTGLVEFVDPHKLKPPIRLDDRGRPEGGTRILARLDKARRPNAGSDIDVVDISPLEQPVFLLEHVIEETPPLILNYGMRLRLLNLLNCNYPFAMMFDLSREDMAEKFHFVDHDIKPNLRTFKFGKTVEVSDQPNKEFLIGARKVESYCRMVKSKVYQAPFATHKPHPTDFILVASIRRTGKAAGSSTGARGVRAGVAYGAFSSASGAPSAASGDGGTDASGAGAGSGEGSSSGTAGAPAAAPSKWPKAVRPKPYDISSKRWFLYLKPIAFLAAVGQAEPLQIVYPPVKEVSLVKKDSVLKKYAPHAEYTTHFCRPWFSWALRKLMVKLKPRPLEKKLIGFYDKTFRLQVGYFPQLHVGKWHTSLVKKENLLSAGFYRDGARYALKSVRERKHEKYELSKPEEVCRYESLQNALARLGQFGIVMNDIWEPASVFYQKLDLVDDLEDMLEAEWHVLKQSVQDRLKRHCFVMRRIKQLIDQCAWQTSFHFRTAIDTGKEEILELRGVGDAGGSMPVNVGVHAKSISSRGDGFVFHRFDRTRERKHIKKQRKRFLNLKEDGTSKVNLTVVGGRVRHVEKTTSVSKKEIVRQYLETIDEEDRDPDFDPNVEWTKSQQWKYVSKIQAVLARRDRGDNEGENMVENKKRRETIVKDAKLIHESQVRSLQMYDDEAAAKFVRRTQERRGTKKKDRGFAVESGRGADQEDEESNEDPEEVKMRKRRQRWRRAQNAPHILPNDPKVSEYQFDQRNFVFDEENQLMRCLSDGPTKRVYIVARRRFDVTEKQFYTEYTRKVEDLEAFCNRQKRLRLYGHRHLLKDEFDERETYLKQQEKEEEEAKERERQERHAMSSGAHRTLRMSFGLGSSAAANRAELTLQREPIGDFIRANLLEKLKYQDSVFYAIDKSIQDLIDNGGRIYQEYVPQVMDIQRGIEWKLPGYKHLHDKRAGAASSSAAKSSRGAKSSTLLKVLDLDLSATQDSLRLSDRLFTRSQLLRVFVHIHHNTFLYWHQLKPDIANYAKELLERARHLLYTSEDAWKFYKKEQFEASKLAQDRRNKNGGTGRSSQRQLVHGSHRSGWGSSHTSRGTHASGEVLSVFDVLDYETVMECVPPAWNIAPDAPDRDDYKRMVDVAPATNGMNGSLGFGHEVRWPKNKPQEVQLCTGRAGTSIYEALNQLRHQEAEEKRKASQ